MIIYFDLKQFKITIGQEKRNYWKELKGKIEVKIEEIIIIAVPI